MIHFWDDKTLERRALEHEEKARELRAELERRGRDAARSVPPPADASSSATGGEEWDYTRDPVNDPRNIR